MRFSLLNLLVSSFLNVPAETSECTDPQRVASFVRATEDDVSLAHHHHFAVDQTKPFAFAFENDFAFVVNHGIFGTDVLQDCSSRE